MLVIIERPFTIITNLDTNSLYNLEPILVTNAHMEVRECNFSRFL